MELCKCSCISYHSYVTPPGFQICDTFLFDSCFLMSCKIKEKKKKESTKVEICSDNDK